MKIEMCECKVPNPTMKVSENGVNVYCKNCSKTYNLSKGKLFE